MTGLQLLGLPESNKYQQDLAKESDIPKTYFSIGFIE